MLEQVLDGFTASKEGEEALAVLQRRGIDASTAKRIVEQAIPVAAGLFAKEGAARVASKAAATPELGLFDLLGGHPGRAFLVGATASLLQGESLSEAVGDGLVAVVGAHVAEVLASRLGLDRNVASWIGAAVAPFLAAYAQRTLTGDARVQRKHGPPLTEAQIHQILAQKQAARMKEALARPESAEAKAILAEQRRKIAARAEHEALQRGKKS